MTIEQIDRYLNELAKSGFSGAKIKITDQNIIDYLQEHYNIDILENNIIFISGLTRPF